MAAEEAADVELVELRGGHTQATDTNSSAQRTALHTAADVNIKDEDGRTALHIAAENGDVDKVRHLIDQGADVNVKDEEGMTPLHWATYYHDTNVVNDIMTYLVDHGADVNIKDDEGRTPLSRLIGPLYRFDSELVRYLVHRGADVNTQGDDMSQKTALHCAVELGDVDTVKHLVDHGADANIKDLNGRTPLHHAAEKGNADAIKYLVDHGAEVNIKDDCGMTPLHMAVKHSSVDIVKYLVDHGADVNIKSNMDVGGLSPLLWYMVMYCESIDVVAYLVDHGADVNIKDEEGGSPLYYAALKGRHDMVRILTEHGADVNDIDEEGRKALVNAKDEDGRIALHTAAENGIVHKVRRLINQGADVSIKDDDGRTALHIAAENGNVETVIHLIDQGADVNIKDEEGMTPLHWATYYHDANVVNDIMRYLVDHGADVNIKDDEGGTPLSLFIGSSFGFDSEMVRYLVDQGADVNTKDETGSQKTALHCAVEDGDVDTVKHLVDHGVDANIKDLNGRTPLHLAAVNCNADVIRYLVEHGADVKIKSDGDLGMTPLHLAVKHRHPNIDIVKYLVGHGADVNPKSDMGGGITPLGLSTLVSFNSEIVRYLADQGADINSQDDNTLRTPFLNVVDTGDTNLVKHFLDLGADVNIQDVDGATPLLLAIRGRHKDIAAILLENEKWKEMLSVADEEGTTAMRALIASMPDVAERALSRCVTTNEGFKKQVDADTNCTLGDEEVHTTSRDFEVTLDYQFLEDFQDSCASDVEASTQGTSDNSWRPKKFTKHNHTLHLMDKHDCSILLKHPLVISLLEYKWTRFARYIFFGNLIFYLVFLSFLTAFGLVVLSPLERTCADVLSGSFNGTVPEDCEGLSIHEYRFLFIGAAVTILTALLRLALEIVQFCRHPLEYLLDWVNWLEIPLYLFSIMFTFVFATPCLCVYSWQWQIGVIAVFLGWIGLITFLQKWPLTGVYVLMFVNIITSFLKIVFLALLLVIAFGLAFYMLLFEPDEMRTPFTHPARAIVKVMAMTIGELDYDSLSHQEEGEDEIAFLPVSLILWITFLVLMPVLLNNLLVGLAVGDVDYLQKTATESRTKLQIDLILNIEQLLQLLGIRHRYIIQSQTLFPNTPETLLPRCCKRGTTDHNLAHDDPPSNTRPARFRRWIATRYSQWGNSNEYSTSGVKISDAITPPPDSLEKQLQKQREHLESELKEQSEQFQDAVKQLSESHKEQVMKQVEEKMEEQLMQMMDNQTKKIEEQAKNMLDNHTEKMEKKMEEHTKNLEKQTKKIIEEQKRTEEMMAKQTEQLVGEVASLKEALEKLVSQMATK